MSRTLLLLLALSAAAWGEAGHPDGSLAPILLVLWAGVVGGTVIGTAIMLRLLSRTFSRWALVPVLGVAAVAGYVGAPQGGTDLSHLIDRLPLWVCVVGSSVLAPLALVSQRRPSA